MLFLRRFLLFFACLVPWFFAGLGFFWVVSQHFPKNGTVSMDIPVDGRSPWFEAFLPGQRASSPGLQSEGWVGQRITDEPVYARLRVPGAYRDADIRVEFRPGAQPLLELGVDRGTAENAAFELHPLWSKELASASFTRMAVGGATWWARPGTSVNDLTKPNEARLFWHAENMPSDAWMDHGAVVPETVSSSLRGTHDFWFVPVDGVIDVTFALQDMNRSLHHTSATFRLMHDETLLWSDAISFGGEKDVKPSVVTQKTIHFEHLSPGAYRLSVLSDDTIFIRAWTTTAKHWVIGPRVYFADEVGYGTSTRSVSIWTNSQHFELKTLHDEGRQTVSLGRASAVLGKTHETYSLARDPAERSGSVSLTLPRGNVWTTGDGYVSWRSDALFFPSPRRLTDETHLLDESVQAVASTYEAPQPIGDGWYAATIHVQLDPTLDRLKIVLAAPGILRRGGAVDVRRFFVTYHRPPLDTHWWETIRQELLRAWRRW